MSGRPQHPRIVLASQSPRRAELLAMLGIAFAALPADIDETYGPDEEPGEHAERLAREKAELIALREDDAVVIGSDTVVVVDGVVLGKPRDDEDAVRMLLLLQGRAHEVATGVAVVENGRTRSAVERVRVVFRAFDAATAAAYVATGEPLDKAGAYGIQGRAGMFVTRIEGSYSGIMGLPLAETTELMQKFGVAVL